MFTKGYVQVYTGNGKGKTTAAIGLAIRAAGAGIRVYIGHFLKGKKTSEHNILDELSSFIKVEFYGREGFKVKKVTSEDEKFAKEGIKRIKEIINSREYGVIIMDEINVAVHFGLLAVEEVISIIKNKPPELELILTGRNAHPKVLELADLITEMKEIKHYAKEGVKARVGIEK